MMNNLHACYLQTWPNEARFHGDEIKKCKVGGGAESETIACMQWLVLYMPPLAGSCYVWVAVLQVQWQVDIFGVAFTTQNQCRE
jgi:hypothetical protein